jgi:hypothetical protein
MFVDIRGATPDGSRRKFKGCHYYAIIAYRLAGDFACRGSAYNRSGGVKPTYIAEQFLVGDQVSTSEGQYQLGLRRIEALGDYNIIPLIINVLDLIDFHDRILDA